MKIACFYDYVYVKINHTKWQFLNFRGRADILTSYAPCPPPIVPLPPPPPSLGCTGSVVLECNHTRDRNEYDITN